MMCDFEVAASADPPEDARGGPGLAGNRFSLDPVLFWSKLGQKWEISSASEEVSLSAGRSVSAHDRLQDTGKKYPQLFRN